jgi:cell division protein FtsA
MRKGAVVDLEKTIASIRESKAQAEQTAGSEIDSAFVSVTGSHIEAHQSNAVVGILDPQKGITEEDTLRAQDLAQRIDIPRGRRLIDVRVREYVVDGQVGIADPVGMNGMRLEVNALLITAAIPQLENVYRAVNQADIDVEDIILSPIAAAEAVLVPDEKELGVALVDIGGGTTDIAVYFQGALVHVAVLPIGGDHFDSDLAYGIGITPRQAEHLKVQLGGVGQGYLNSTDIIEITKGGDKTGSIPHKIIADIIQPRLEEALTLVRDELTKAGLMKHIPSGMVLTGGMALLPGITDMTPKIIGVQARIGYPQNIEGLTPDVRSPAFAVAVGLVKLGHLEYREKQRIADVSPLTSALATASDWRQKAMKWIFK